MKISVNTLALGAHPCWSKKRTRHRHIRLIGVFVGPTEVPVPCVLTKVVALGAYSICMWGAQSLHDTAYSV